VRKSNSRPAISDPDTPLLAPPHPTCPGRLLKRNNVFCIFDTTLSSRCQVLQCLWLKDHNIPRTDCSAGRRNSHRYWLRFQPHPDAATRKNFSPSNPSLVCASYSCAKEGAAIDEERLFANAFIDAAHVQPVWTLPRPYPHAVFRDCSRVRLHLEHIASNIRRPTRSAPP